MKHAQAFIIIAIVVAVSHPLIATASDVDLAQL